MDDGRLENEFKEKPSYDSLYENTPAAFGGKEGAPEAFVTELPRILTGGRILEIGAGQGRNALWLARQGFSVEATDLSEVGVQQMQSRAREEGLALTAAVADARAPVSGEYEGAVCTYVLHHLPIADALGVVRTLQEHTANKGCHAVAAFTKQGDFFAANTETPYWYAETEELRRLYTGWDIVRYEESVKQALATKEDGGALYNTVARIVAIKN